MKKKRKPIIGIIIGVLLLVALSVLNGCIFSTKEKNIVPRDSYASYIDRDKLDNNLVKDFYRNVTIKIDPPEEGSEGESRISVTIPALTEIYKEHYDEIANAKSKEDAQAIICDHISDWEYVEEVTETVYKAGDEWRLKTFENVDEILNAEVDDLLAHIVADADWETYEIDIKGIVDLANDWEVKTDETSD